MEPTQVLHFYLGCDCFYKSSKGTAIAKLDANIIGCPAHYPDLKLSLRPLSSMTEEEGREMCMFLTKTEKCYNNVLWLQNRLKKDLPPELFAFLLSKGFDLFNLIPEGKAIDATTLTQKQ